MTCIDLKSFTLYLGDLHDDGKMHVFFNQVNDMGSEVSLKIRSKQA